MAAYYSRITPPDLRRALQERRCYRLDYQTVPGEHAVYSATLEGREPERELIQNPDKRAFGRAPTKQTSAHTCGLFERMDLTEGLYERKGVKDDSSNRSESSL